MSTPSANTDRLGAYVPRTLSLLLHDALCARGPEGIEELTGVLNGTFGPMVDTIAEHGGDTLRFADDAPIAIWWSRQPGDLARLPRTAKKFPVRHAPGQGFQATNLIILRRTVPRSQVSIR